jgi:ATP-dependent Clp protease protease subunit
MVHQGHVRLTIDSEITKTSATKLCADMRRFCEQGAKTIDLVITSPGGSLWAGLMIVDTMESIKTRGCVIRTMVQGRAASAATLVSVSGTKGSRFMLPHSRMLLHDLKSVVREASFDINDVELLAESMKEMSEEAKNVYKKNCEALQDDKVLLEAAMARDEWFKADQCLAKNLVDIVGPLPWEELHRPSGRMFLI